MSVTARHHKFVEKVLFNTDSHFLLETHTSICFDLLFKFLQVLLSLTISEYR